MTPDFIGGAAASALPVSPDRFLRLSQVMELVAFKKSHIYAMVASGTFPAPLKPGGSASRWSQNDVLDWLASFTSTKVH
ncbi:AlpA family phage regulatory protein [Sphingomonas sp. PB2P19]|uniref:helix-turn-helix transcriptional regulator n=1 Tax=Sphingomonas rhamnosi TaxID=3096156 RepID=UPI002FCA038B